MTVNFTIVMQKKKCLIYLQTPTLPHVHSPFLYHLIEREKAVTVLNQTYFYKNLIHLFTLRYLTNRKWVLFNHNLRSSVSK